VKIHIIILFIFSLLTFNCSSSPRFTSDDNNEKSTRYTKPKNENEKRIPDTNKNTPVKSGSTESVSGVASYYSEKFHGRKTANGETYDMHALTAAHENYPFNTIVRVRNLKNNKTVTLRINDRKPDFNGRIIDVSLKAAQELDMVISGIAHVQVEVLEWGK
jgi:rare lipoprotein A